MHQTSKSGSLLRGDKLGVRIVGPQLAKGFIVKKIALVEDENAADTTGVNLPKNVVDGPDLLLPVDIMGIHDL